MKSVSQFFYTLYFRIRKIAENWQLKSGQILMIKFFLSCIENLTHDIVLESRIGGNVPERNVSEFLAEARLFGFGQASRVDGERAAEVFVVDDDVDAVAGGGAAVLAGVARAVARRGGGVVADVVFAGDVDFFVDFGAVDADCVVFGLAVFADKGGNGEGVFLRL